MENKIIVSCPNCSAQLRIPRDKHIVFTCPHCGIQYEMINGKSIHKYREEEKKTKFVKKVLKFAAIAVILLIIAFIAYPKITAPPDIHETKAYALKDSIWNDFRGKYPYQFQMVGLSKYDDGSYLLILSEPPTHVTEDEIHNILNENNYDLSIQKQRIGYDGWVKDIVICINGLKPEKFDKLLSQIQQHLFHTDYKAYTYNLPIKSKAPDFLPYDLNYQISTDELYQWFIKDGEKIIKDKSDNSQTLDDIFSQHEEGVFYSKNPGFVVWVLPKNNSITDKEAETRQFSLDADLILGSINSDNYVAIIGREREIPVYDLPPLRVETIMLLAENTDKEQLGQSFVYDNWFLGKQKGGKDWYFAWLCPELINTEYGNLLNWTDHVLKSWTDCDSLKCEYINFPNPIEYPFEKPLFNTLKSQSLVYNWSSENLTYTFEYDNYNVLACLGGSGCLPITYIPTWSNLKDSVSIERYKETGFYYFSNINNPNIARVVQYQTLYQIFQNANIRSHKNYYDYNENVGHNLNLLSWYSRQIIEKINSLEEGDIKLIAHRCAEKQKHDKALKKHESVFQAIKDSDYSDLTAEGVLLKENFLKYSNYSAYIVAENLNFLHDYFLSLDEDEKDFFSLSLSLPNIHEDEINMAEDLLNRKIAELNNHNRSLMSYQAYKLISERAKIPIMKYEDWIKSRKEKIENKYKEYLFENGKQNISSLLNFFAEYLGFDKTRIKNDFINKQSNDLNSWVKTPLIVETWNNLDSAIYTGGHNLFSKPIKFKFDNTLQKGISVAKEKNIVRVANIEKGNIKNTLNMYVKQNKIGVRNIYAENETNLNRLRSEVFPSSNRTARGFSTSEHLSITQKTDCFKIGSNELKTRTEVVDYLVKENKSAKIIFEDYTVNEVKATITNADITQTVYLKKTNIPELRIDYSSASYEIISDNQIEVTFKYVGKKASHTKLLFKDIPIEKVKVYLEKLGGGKNSNGIYRDINIPRNKVKGIIEWELKNGVISDNHKQNERYNERIDLSSNAA